MTSNSHAYENLITDSEQGCDSSQDFARGDSKAGVPAEPPSCSSSCRFVAITLMILAAVGAAALSAVSGHKLYQLKDRVVECSYMRFELNSDSMTQCSLDSGHFEPPCRVNSSARGGAAIVPSTAYNSAIGPWKLGEDARPPLDEKDAGSCDIELTRKGTHLVIKKSGLYQLSAQVTFSPVGNSAHPAADSQLVWQVNSEEWIATHRAQSHDGGPVNTYLSAVRRLQAGQRISLHVTQVSQDRPAKIGLEPASTHILVSML